ncbi:hypothetical protein P154DRAFT_524975 [Amniculicola lignicola CBS 123094]|uniref:Calcium channel subunit Mid1 n=1 Tax=Amniculicola lignicola CBS 123094 TaxID=1392246 RepID=A0A6A5WHL7_9PLEO|nr:hypothetical protein P154DRAFT_524975 [Amniculicola lignicola CBS 123094]
MQLPRLTPLQSRLLASATATAILVVIWISFQPVRFVYAGEIPQRAPSPSDPETPLNGWIPPSSPLVDLPDSGELLQRREEQRHVEERGSGEGSLDAAYVPDFAYFDRSVIGRAADGVDALTNNVATGLDTNPGTTKNFVLEKTQIDQKKQPQRRRAWRDPLREKSVEDESASDIEEGNEEEEEEEEEEEDHLDTEEHEREEGDTERPGELKIRKRQNDGKRVFISVTTCRQPNPKGGMLQTNPAPQLTLYISTSTQNQKPGPNSQENLVTPPIPFVNGSAQFNISTRSDVFLGVGAPNLTQGWEGNWHFQIVGSIDGYYHTYAGDNPFLKLVDTDSESTLFITDVLHNRTSDPGKDQEIHNQMMAMQSQYTMYAFAEDTGGRMQGLERSFCGLQEQFRNQSTIIVNSTMTDRLEGLPRGQLHVQGLTADTKYYGFLVLNGNGTTSSINVPGAGDVRGGGKVYKQFNWKTKATDSCQVIYDLEFCTSIAQAVPSSPKFKQNTTALATLYDSEAKRYYENFSNSLAQIACNTTATAQYSLAQNCTSCASSYKDWLCAVLMPRCSDFDTPNEHKIFIDRNINTPLPNGSIPYAYNTSAEFNTTVRERFAFSKSRNKIIDTEIQPGPYKEMPPCEYLCFDIVRSCPSQLGFSCPGGKIAQWSYGQRKPKDPGNQTLTCNFPGAVQELGDKPGSAGLVMAQGALSVLVAVVVGGLMV